MHPPTPETFAALVRIRYVQRIRQAIGEIRGGESPDFSLGVADGMVSALYDLGASDAYGKLRRVERLRNWGKS